MTTEQHQLDLDRAGQIHSVIRDANEALRRATTRQELIAVTCDRLAESSLYSSAAIDLTTAGIADERTDGEENGLRAHAGSACPRVDRRFADDDASDNGDRGTDDGDRTITDGDGSAASIRTTKTDEPRVSHDAGENGSAPADEGGSQSSLAVPIVHGEARYGVLVVCSAERSAFAEGETNALSDLASAVGHAIEAIDAKQALITGSLVELDIRIDDAEHFITHVSEAADCTVSLDGAVRRDGDTLLYFCTVSGAEPEAVSEIAHESTVIERARLVRTNADAEEDGDTEENGDAEDPEAGIESLFEFTYSGPCPVVLLTDHGAEVVALNAGGGETRLRCELPRSADVRRVIESLREEFPGTDLVARHNTTRPARTERDVRRTLFESLTDRQRTALETAHHAGLYEWPRASTIEEVANSLGIAGPTFSKHRRAAERKLLTAVFDDSGGSDADGTTADRDR